MTALAIKYMTNHHGNDIFRRVLQALRTWHDRAVQRAELSRWSEQELHDIGLSHSMIATEIEKPFWRA